MGLKKEDLKKLYQASILIIFKQGVTDKEKQEIINKLYLDNKDKIKSMQYVEAKLKTNMSEYWFTFIDNFKKGKKN